ncbi:NgoMIV family type II restriction endonuclease [Kitasatospora sp. P5_F3]
MPAPFAVDLCGYRNGLPNTSDASQRLSVEIGRAFFEHIGVAVDQEVGKVDKIWSRSMVADLSARLAGPAPQLTVDEECWPHRFEQYAHLRALQELAGDESSDVERALEDLALHIRSLGHGPGLERAAALLGTLGGAIETAAARRRPLLDLLGDESLLRLDIAVHRQGRPDRDSRAAPHLVAGFSLKWTLRTDRLQDPRIQGSKMASLRRGRMPHFAAVTMEPRPYMLGRLGGGTGDLDCVYHLHLPGLTAAVDDVYSDNPARRKQRDTFRRMVDQGRLRDYDDLVAYLATVWSPPDTGQVRS